jgi:Mg-chelatase subunit ChlI
MEKNEFFTSCDTVANLHFPRWHELPEFELYMDQVIGLIEKYLRPLYPESKAPITPSMINNYVKNGALPPPQNKKYNRTHLALLMIICSAKSILEISSISDILNQSISASNIETALDQFAEMYENALASAVKKAKLAVSVSELDTKHILSAVAIENALNANASRVVSMYAYNMIATKPDPEEAEKNEKAEKEAEKAEKEAEKAKKKADKKAEKKAEKKTEAKENSDETNS